MWRTTTANDEAIKKAKPRRWRIVLVRKRGQYLGTVEAPDAEGAIKVAIKEFGI